jgi:mono/diheme cytochrome c family protein
VIGLGNTSYDYTSPDTQSNLATDAELLLTDPNEIAELTKFADRLSTIAGYTKTLAQGVNPADNVAAVLFAHRDQNSLAWSDTPILAVPPVVVVPVDVPPWWRMQKKNAMFYTAAGRGDHARVMMTASTLCVDSVDDAKAIDAYFPDIAAYINTIVPPKFPYAIDSDLASTGQGVFEQNCARCHGTYGANGTYPNLVISLADVQTDPFLATGAAQFAGMYEDWFNGSFYGEIAQLDSLDGYYAPPLDGIWATAPYLHNGSIPTIAALLDSSTRPTYWTRSFDSTDYDPAALGWNFTTLTAAQAKAYDTTQGGYSNSGHTYGDALTDSERNAVLEYLKTL